MDELWYHVHQFILPLADSYCSFHILFMYHALISCSFHVQCIMFIFTMYVRCSPFFLIDHFRNQMLLIKWVIFFWSSKIFFCTFQHSQSGRIYNVVSTLINVVKLDVKNNNIVSTLSNVPNINVEKDNVDLTLLNVNIHNVDLILSDVAMLFHPNNNICWVLKNVAKWIIFRNNRVKAHIL